MLGAWENVIEIHKEDYLEVYSTHLIHCVVCCFTLVHTRTHAHTRSPRAAATAPTLGVSTRESRRVKTPRTFTEAVSLIFLDEITVGRLCLLLLNVSALSPSACSSTTHARAALTAAKAASSFCVKQAEM